MTSTDWPSIAVVIPAFNAEGFILDTLNSLSTQTYAPQQIVVVNDGSTDRTSEIVQEWAKSSRLTLQLENITNTGVSNARNRGVQLAECDFVAFLDADDIWEQDKLLKQASLLRTSSQVSSLATWYYTFIKRGHHQEVVKPAWSRSYVAKWACFARRGPLLTSTLLMPRALFVELGGFRVDLGTLADLDFALRLAETGDFQVVKEPLVGYRIHANQMHRDWLQTSDDLGRMHPQDYTLLADVGETEWVNKARVAHNWHSRTTAVVPKTFPKFWLRNLATHLTTATKYSIARVETELRFRKIS